MASEAEKNEVLKFLGVPESVQPVMDLLGMFIRPRPNASTLAIMSRMRSVFSIYLPGVARPDDCVITDLTDDCHEMPEGWWVEIIEGMVELRRERTERTESHDK